MNWIFYGVLALIIFLVIDCYNRLVKNRMQTKEAWSQIDVQLKRRNDLLPNLIETVKGFEAVAFPSFASLFVGTIILIL